jgi:hypothetical protein
LLSHAQTNHASLACCPQAVLSSRQHTLAPGPHMQTFAPPQTCRAPGCCTGPRRSTGCTGGSGRAQRRCALSRTSCRVQSKVCAGACADPATKPAPSAAARAARAHARTSKFFPLSRPVSSLRKVDLPEPGEPSSSVMRPCVVVFACHAPAVLRGVAPPAVYCTHGPQLPAAQDAAQQPPSPPP